MSVRNRLRKALAAFKEADYASAAQECHRVVETDPQSHDAYVYAIPRHVHSSAIPSLAVY